MSKSKSAAIAGALGLFLTILLWFIVRAGNAADPSGEVSGASQTPPRRKAYFEAQLQKNPGNAPLLVRLGQVERSMGKNAEARRHFEQAISSDPNATDARLELGLLCSQTGDAAEAVTQYQAVLLQNPHQVDALYNLGLIAANGGDLDEARQYWRAAAQYGADRESGRLAAGNLARLGSAPNPPARPPP
ncbi:MAG: tetratricopeptide repeat protein [Bryobacteraceae bacterium]